MNCRKNINYTLELLKNGNLNIYEGTTCTSRTLRWQNISVKDAVEAISGWIVPWVEAVMEDSTDK
jgi:hypothetical protein